MSGKSLVTAPTSEPLALGEVKRARVIEHNDDDIYLNSLIAAARAHVENYTNRKLVTQTWDFFFNEFEDCIELSFPPLQSVSSVNYKDTSDVEQVLATTVYQVDTTGLIGRVALAPNQSWPSISDEINAVRIRADVGYGAASAVPADLKHAMILLVGHWHENREQVVFGQPYSLPHAFEALAFPYRVLSV